MPRQEYYMYNYPCPLFSLPTQKKKITCVSKYQTIIPPLNVKQYCPQMSYNISPKCHTMLPQMSYNIAPKCHTIFSPCHTIFSPNVIQYFPHVIQYFPKLSYNTPPPKCHIIFPQMSYNIILSPKVIQLPPPPQKKMSYSISPTCHKYSSPPKPKRFRINFVSQVADKLPSLIKIP